MFVNYREPLKSEHLINSNRNTLEAQIQVLRGFVNENLQVLGVFNG